MRQVKDSRQPVALQHQSCLSALWTAYPLLSEPTNNQLMRPSAEKSVPYTYLFQEMTGCNQVLYPQGRGIYQKDLV